MQDLSKKLQTTTHDANLTQLNVLKLQESQAAKGSEVEDKAQETREEAAKKRMEYAMREAEREAASHSFDDLSDEEIRKEELEKDEV